jgi:hypothetical protein
MGLMASIISCSLKSFPPPLKGTTPMAALPFALLAASAITNVIGAITSAQHQASADKYNASIAEQNSVAAQQQAAASAVIQQEHAKKQIGATIAGYGASSVTMDGSPLDVLAESASSAERDKQTILYKGQLQAAGYQDQAALDRSEATNSLSSGYMKATGILMSAGAKAWDMSGSGASKDFDMTQVP